MMGANSMYTMSDLHNYKHETWRVNKTTVWKHVGFFGQARSIGVNFHTLQIIHESQNLEPINIRHKIPSMPQNLPETPLQCTPPGHWMQDHHYYLKYNQYNQCELSQRNKRKMFSRGDKEIFSYVGFANTHTQKKQIYNL